MVSTNQGIPKNSVEAVLQILFFTIYADREHKPQEMAEIWSQIPKLQVFTDNDAFPDISGLSELIQTYDSKVRDLMDETDLHAEIESAIRLIDSPLLVPMVLASMKAIAHADQEYHHTEDDIIKTASRIWGVAA